MFLRKALRNNASLRKIYARFTHGIHAKAENRGAGIDELTFHDTRHEAITRLASVFNPLELARVVGHSNLSQLLVYYNATAEDLAGRLG